MDGSGGSPKRVVRVLIVEPTEGLSGADTGTSLACASLNCSILWQSPENQLNGSSYRLEIGQAWQAGTVGPRR